MVLLANDRIHSSPESDYYFSANNKQPPARHSHQDEYSSTSHSVATCLSFHCRPRQTLGSLCRPRQKAVRTRCRAAKCLWKERLGLQHGPDEQVNLCYQEMYQEIYQEICRPGRSRAGGREEGGNMTLTPQPLKLDGWVVQFWAYLGVIGQVIIWLTSLDLKPDITGFEAGVGRTSYCRYNEAADGMGCSHASLSATLSRSTQRMRLGSFSSETHPVEGMHGTHGWRARSEPA